MSVPKTNAEFVEMLVHYIPTFFVPADKVIGAMPPALRQAVTNQSSFLFFLKRFKHYLDIRTNYGNTDVRLKPNFAHDKRGCADSIYTSLLGMDTSAFTPGLAPTPTAATLKKGEKGKEDAAAEGGGGEKGMSVDEQLNRQAASALARRPARHSEEHLLSLLLPHLPENFTPLAKLLPEITDLIVRHPSFDSRVGVTGVLQRHGNYIQIVDGSCRVRPYRVAPNALAEHAWTDSPEPALMAKLRPLLEEAAAAATTAEAGEAASSPSPLDEQQRRLRQQMQVSTGRLYAQLTPEEKLHVKRTYRSFPRLLRLHGGVLTVAPDLMRVSLFRPELEPCAETLLADGLLRHSIRPDDPIVKIPATMAMPVEEAAAEWALQELYDALPLTQCVRLADLLVLVPTSVREGLPREVDPLLAKLRRFPDYFLVWRDPDEAAATPTTAEHWFLQRAKLQVPSYSVEELLQMVLPLIPMGGCTTAALLRRAPLPLQLYLAHHGLRRTLSGEDFCPDPAQGASLQQQEEREKQKKLLQQCIAVQGERVFRLR